MLGRRPFHDPDPRRPRAAGVGPGARPGGRTRVGYQLAPASEVNAGRGEVFDEAQIFRMEHYLGKETVQNLMALRFANALFEPVWNRNFIDHVQITAAEDIGIGGRDGHYAGAGAVRAPRPHHIRPLHPRPA